MQNAKEIATHIVAAFEIAIATCRAQRDPHPPDRVVARLELLAYEAVGGTHPAPADKGAVGAFRA